MGTYPIERIEENVKSIRSRIAQAAQSAGKRPEEILLCAVSKTRTPEILRASSILDFDFFGENRVNELKEKLAAGAYGSKPVHFIGKLQTNKVKDVVGRVAMIHSVDSIKLAELIAKEACRRQMVQDVLVQINIGAEETKGGILPEALPAFLEKAAGLEQIRVRGLMSIPPNVQGREENRRNLQSLYHLFLDIKGKKYDNVCADFLSMGMSRDFEDAVLCGANIVRVGSALFGPRDMIEDV